MIENKNNVSNIFILQERVKRFCSHPIVTTTKGEEIRKLPSIRTSACLVCGLKRVGKNKTGWPSQRLCVAQSGEGICPEGHDEKLQALLAQS